MADGALGRAATAAAPPAIELHAVRFHWRGRPSFALSVDTLRVEHGERVLLAGPSGSGKSTLLSLLCGVVAPDSGTIQVLGTDLAGLPGTRRDRFRGEHFGILFQMFNLLPYASVMDNVVLPLHFAPGRRRRAAERGGTAAEAARLLETLGINAGLARADAARLSVWQQQRVAAARALIGAPEIVVADEPTSALDRDSQQAFLDLLFAEAARVATTVVMVSHDASLAGRFDRVLRLADIARVERGH